MNDRWGGIDRGRATAGRWGSGALTAAAAVLLAACSPPSGAPERAASPPAETPLQYYTMTGLRMPADVRHRPVLAVKVDDTAAGRPQQGVEQADTVVQEPVEGGLTRLMAFYESSRPESVGPVRSVRTTDISLVQTPGAITIASGGSPPVLTAFQNAGIPLLTEGDEALVRNPQRIAPYNLYLDTSEVTRADGGRAARRPFLRFGEFDYPDGKRVSRVRVDFSPSASDTWRRGAGNRWRREGDERPFPADTLLILGVKLRDTGQRDVAGTPVPEAEVTGTGAGFLLVGDSVHIVKWRRRTETSPFVLSTKAGLTVAVPPGRSWITLLSKDTGKVSFD